MGVSDRVTLAGPFGGDDAIDAVIARHCLFGLSSLFEGLPLAILHAIARGRVMVATDVGGAPEILEPSGAGLLVPAADPRAMAGAFETLIDDPALVLRMSEAAVATFRQRFHPDRVLPQLIAFYREIRA
ncbi:MAG: glycosyltransferase family 4 protein [Sphingomonas sp.]